MYSAEHTTSCKHALKLKVKEEWLMIKSRDILSLNLFEICNEFNFRLERKGLYRKHYLSTLDAAQKKIYHRFCSRGDVEPREADINLFRIISSLPLRSKNKKQCINTMPIMPMWFRSPAQWPVTRFSSYYILGFTFLWIPDDWWMMLMTAD